MMSEMFFIRFLYFDVGIDRNLLLCGAGMELFGKFPLDIRRRFAYTVLTSNKIIVMIVNIFEILGHKTHKSWML